MREIKFRAWDTADRIMLEPDRVKFFDLLTVNGKGSIYRFMQYTGLKDRRGVDIYEGDVVREYPSRGSYWVRSVEYTDHGFQLSDLAYFLQHEVDWGRQLEIIGNIYENPELLEQAND